MINISFGNLPQTSGMQIYITPAIASQQAVSLPQTAPAQFSFSVAPSQTQPQMTFNFGNWYPAVAQSVGNVYALGQSTMANFGQATGQFLGNIGSAINTMGSSLNSLGNNGMAFFGGFIPAPKAQATRSVFGSQASQTPMTFAQSMQSFAIGAQQAFQQMGNIIQNHAPAALAFGGAVAASTAICPCMTGAMIGTAGIAMGQQLYAAHQHAA